MRALQTSQDPTYFDVRNHELGLLGYTLHDPMRHCHQRYVRIPFISNQRAQYFPRAETAYAPPSRMDDSVRTLLLEVDKVHFSGESYYSWFCEPSVAVDLIDAQWICSIGRDQINEFTHRVWEAIRRSRPMDTAWMHFPSTPATQPERPAPTPASDPKPEPVVIEYRGRRINLKD